MPILRRAVSLKFFLGGSLYNYRIQGDIFGYQEDNSSINWSLKGNANIIITAALNSLPILTCDPRQLQLRVGTRCFILPILR